MTSNQYLEAMIERSDNLGVLRHIRAHKLREPDLVLHHGSLLLGESDITAITAKPEGQPLLASSLFSKSDLSERLAVLEQLTLAALDTTNHDTSSTTAFAERTLTQIRELVGNDSVRYRRLLAQCLEREDNFAGALEIYDDLLEENPSNVHALRRKYCILRARQHLTGDETGMEPREALNDYLERNGSDASAWAEMSKICAEVGDYAGAVYAGEEVVLSSPLNSEAHCTLGEWYATVGGTENLKLAKKHLAQSLELDPGNLRATFALVSTAESYLEDAETESGGTGRKKKKRNVFDDEDLEITKEIHKFGVERLSKLYKGTSMSGLMEKLCGEIVR